MNNSPKLFRFLYILFWLITLILTILSIISIIYHIYILFGPYIISRILKYKDHRFPDYVYEVWSTDIKELQLDQWGLLFGTVVVSFIAIKVLRIKNPFYIFYNNYYYNNSSSSKIEKKNE
eukprot:GHVR01121321.1.p1 GENE.GHVR01121321.1~~GHVR01121321.1.p1  ORF type:complete len:120 (+),score=20.08 GHVR01121321.1:34-393(+)